MFNYFLKIILLCSPISLFASEAGSKVELEFTQDELKAMDKWKSLSFEDLARDAMKGDAVGLYMIGCVYLYGMKGFTIDVNHADNFFAFSASFGFAPAIDKIRAMYMEQNNLFLLFVYNNLTISYGHSEFVMKYHEFRDAIRKKFGTKVCEEIERIAAEKREAIEKNIENLKLAKDKSEFVFDLVAKHQRLPDEDHKYSLDYWLKFAELPKG
jgi:hypothetical protein